jgi:hypothetical protein
VLALVVAWCRRCCWGSSTSTLVLVLALVLMLAPVLALVPVLAPVVLSLPPMLLGLAPAL